MASLRKQAFIQLQKKTFDTCIIGGGIQGASIAAALANRGYKVALIEANDFASGSSQESSNFIWGGIKYLENFEFKLVYKLCRARNRLLKYCPAQVKETRFRLLLPFTLSILVYIGAWVYWLMGARYTQRPCYLFHYKKNGYILQKSKFKCAVEYSDAILPEYDARFVYFFIRRAQNYGATVCNYAKLTAAKKSENDWQLQITDQCSGDQEHRISVKARFLINAAGYAVQHVNEILNHSSNQSVVFSKGVHLIVRSKLSQPINAVISFLSSDKRPFFVIPMRKNTFCLGTTDVRCQKSEGYVNDEDKNFILKNVKNNLGHEFSFEKTQIISERCGFRTLVANKKIKQHDWLSLSRGHVFEANKNRKLLSIYGGKLTDCVNIGDEVVKIYEKLYSITHPKKNKNRYWYAETTSQYEKIATVLKQFYNCNEQELELLLKSLHGRYLEHTEKLADYIFHIATHASPSDMHQLCSECIVGCRVLFVEYFFCVRYEYVVDRVDFLRRRSGLALVYSKQDIKQINIKLDQLQKVVVL